MADQIGNQCIDIRLQSPVYEGKGWISQRDVQTWACANATAHENNPQQVSFGSLRSTYLAARPGLIE